MATSYNVGIVKTDIYFVANKICKKRYQNRKFIIYTCYVFVQF